MAQQIFDKDGNPLDVGGVVSIVRQLLSGVPIAKINGIQLYAPQGGGGGDSTKYVTVATSDKIGIIGDSYAESAYAVKGKSYIAKLSLFSDFNFVNFGKSGDIYLGRIYDIRRKAARYGTLSYDGYKPKYSMLCCFTNDIKYLSEEEYAECLENAIKTCRGIGSEPIVCTEYHTGLTRTTSIVEARRDLMRKIAKKNDCEFWDIATYCDLLFENSRKYAPFWGGTHPATRTNAMESDGYEMYLEHFERPKQSIKVFRLRGTYSNLDDLMFATNYERAKIFQEINVGERAIDSVANVDNCTEHSGSVVNDEYGKLIQGTAISFINIALISCVLPAWGKDLTSLSAQFTASANVTVYVKRSTATPYSQPTQLANFYIGANESASVGDVYTCAEDNKNYTVVEVMVDEGGNKHLLASGSTTVAATSGTLTKVSGSGDSTLHYTYREVGYPSSVLGNDTCGHWIVAEGSNGVYDLTSVIGDCVDVDKVHILVVGSSFTLKDIAFGYTANCEKSVVRKPALEFKTNYYNSNTELLPSQKFGTAGTLDSNWNVTPVQTYEQTQGTNVLPLSDMVSVVKVSNSVNLSCTITPSKSGMAVLELWCRYFPAVYTNGSGNQITETSFDYNDVVVTLDNAVPLSQRVNTHWKIVRFNVQLANSKQTSIKISSDANGIEVAYVSLKFVE